MSSGITFSRLEYAKVFVLQTLAVGRTYKY